jgi:hypothetical protein
MLRQANLPEKAKLAGRVIGLGKKQERRGTP